MLILNDITMPNLFKLRVGEAYRKNDTFFHSISMIQSYF
jgi:hypothetical protein